MFHSELNPKLEIDISLPAEETLKNLIPFDWNNFPFQFKTLDCKFIG